MCFHFFPLKNYATKGTDATTKFPFLFKLYNSTVARVNVFTAARKPIASE